MKHPIIFAVDDDTQVLKAISRDLRQQFRKQYRIMGTDKQQEVLDTLPELKKKGEEVALFLSDQRMPDMLGVEMLEKARKFFPDARKMLLTAYSDIDAAIKAINDVQWDHYLSKPWDPPEEKLFPVVEDLLEAWQMHYITDFQGIKVIGYQYNPRSHEVKDFLAGNLIPYLWLDIEKNEKAQELIALHVLQKQDLPAIIFEDQSTEAPADIAAIARKMGMKVDAAASLYDVVIVGAGPAGLAAAVYGSSEGLKTLLVEKRALSGQPGTSSRIESYLGFPKGLSGSDLTRRAISQARRLGTEFLSPVEVNGVTLQDNYKIL